MGTLSAQDVKRLAFCLDKLPPVDESHETDFKTAPEKLLDCVLSLHRRYDEFAVPRIRRFKNRHLDVYSLPSLRQCVAKCGSPMRFYRDELDYDYDDAAQMFGRLLDYLINESNKYPGNNEMEKCQRWAISARIDEYKRIWRGSNIPLFGIAGWQYLRMLFGADTCKPDIAVKGYVKDCLKRDFSERSIVELMEAAAPLAPSLKTFLQPVREADRRIWHQYNSKSKQSKSKINCH